MIKHFEYIWSWLVLTLWCLIILWTLSLCAGCGHVTKLGIAYTEAPGTAGAGLHIELVDAAQIDAAWRAAEHTWGQGDPEEVIITFYSIPIQYDDGLYSGLTYGRETSVYLRPGQERCLFYTGNALEHELGHVLLFMNGSSDGDPQHKDPRWLHQSDSDRYKLEVELCSPQ